MNLALKCPDPSAARPLPPRLLEDHTGQNHQHLHLHIQRQSSCSFRLVKRNLPFYETNPLLRWSQIQGKFYIKWVGGIDIAQTTASICKLVFFPLFFLIFFLVKRCFWYNGDKVLRHHELAPVEQRDGDGGGKRVGPHLRVPHLPTYPWIINCRFDLSGCRRHWPGKL